MKFTFTVVGNSFRPAEAKAVMKSLSVGDEVYFEREPENPYDENAIKVIAFDPEEENSDEEIHIGYIEGSVAAELAPLLDDMEDPRDLTGVILSFLTPTKPHVELILPD